jgi:hypothetical protein
MPKVRMQLELSVANRNPHAATNLANVEDIILNALLDYFSESIPKSEWLATSIKISHMENKKCGVLWKKLR